MLKENTESKLQAWIGPETWHTSHDSDMNRFYDFVNEYQQEHGYTMDEAAVREHIEQKIGHGISDALRKIIRERLSLAYCILDFLKQTNR